MAVDPACPKCGGVLPVDAPQGLCPACLMAVALGEEPVEPSSIDPGQPDRSTMNDGATLPLKAADPHDTPTTAPFSPADLPTEPALEAAPSLGSVRYFGDYELISEIARGGMGVVYRARQVSLNRPVALKMILAGNLAGEDDIRRFHIEAEAAANLDHPGIVPIYEIGEHDGRHFFSMGFVEGTSLAAKVANGPLPPREAADLTMQVAEAMQYAHERGVIHRDLKPANLLLNRQGRPKVTDFGLAKKLQGDSGLTHTGQIMGTPSYMPPEQAEGKDVGPLADVYALGAILYCLLTGRPPFQAASPMDTLRQVLEREPVPPRQLNPSVLRDVETICLKCLEKEPGKRYASAKALAKDLDRYLSGEPILARRVGRIEKVSKWVRRRPVIAGLSAAVVFMGALGLSGIIWQWLRAERNFSESEKNRIIALSQTIEAEAQRKVAEEKTIEAQARADQLERQGYISLVGLSLRESQADNITLAERSLERCPPRLRGWEWRYCNWSNHRELKTIRRGTGTRHIYRAARSPDGNSIACISGKSVWICDLEGREICSMEGHDDQVNCVTWSPDGKTVATGGRDHLIHLWDGKTGTHQGVLKGHEIWVFSVRFSPDGTKLAAAAGAWPNIPNRHPEVKIWDVAARRVIHSLQGVRGASALDVAFSSDGKRLAASETLSMAHVWEVDTGMKILDLERGHTQPVLGVAFSPDGKYPATCGEDGLVVLWDGATGVQIRNMRGHTGSISGVGFHPAGSRLVTASSDSTAKIWDVETGSPLVTLRGHHGPVSSVEYDRIGGQILSAAGDDMIKIWDATIESEPLALVGHTG